MEDVILRLVNREGVDPDLEEQLRIYELVLQHEDDGADGALLSGATDNIRSVYSASANVLRNITYATLYRNLHVYNLYDEIIISILGLV